MLFAEGVPNAAAAHVSLMFSLKGACQTIIGSRTAGLDAMRLAALRIATGEWDRAIVGAAEEFDPTVNACYKHCGLHACDTPSAAFSDERGFVTSAAAVTFILESEDSMRGRNANPRGRIGSHASAHSMSDVLNSLQHAKHVYSSANGTWIDRTERAAMTTARQISTLYGHIAECFSVLPLLSVAAAMRTKSAEEIGVVATDYNGVSSGISVIRLGKM
jgi:3-oxoacyl-[acyl-carrier-protein] synthase II